MKKKSIIHPQNNTALRLKELLYHVMFNHLEELKRLNQHKDEFITNLSDDLRNPLTSMRMAITLLKNSLDRDNYINNETGNLYLNILKTQCDREINLINNLLKSQDIKKGYLNTNIQQVLLEPIMIEFQENFNQEWEYKNLTLTVNCELDYIYLDLKSFQLILEQLLYNAGKFSIENNKVTLSIYKEIKQTILTITNTGNEISQSQQKQISTPFYQNNNFTEINNPVFGLALVKSLVEYFNGTIAVSSICCQNNIDYLNTFTITFSE